MATEFVMTGRGVSGEMMCGPSPGMANEISLEPLLVASRIAWRNDPGSLSAVLVTTYEAPKTQRGIARCARSDAKASQAASAFALPRHRRAVLILLVMR